MTRLARVFRPLMSLASLTSIASIASITLLAGCAAGPDFVRPAPPTDRAVLKTPLPELTASADVSQGEAQRWLEGMSLPERWWTLFGSPALDRLVEQALVANPSVHSAQAALKVAEQNVRAQRALFLPQVQAQFSPSRQRQSNVVSPALNSGQPTYNLFTGQLAISYAPDVFGGNRRQVESLQASAEQQQYQLQATYLTLVSNVVATAIQEASLRAQIDAAGQVLDLQREQLGIFQRQLDLGAIAESDVIALRAQLAQTEASLPPLRKQLALSRDALTALLGRLPADEPDERFELDSLKLPVELPRVLPSQVVERRPDVQAAEAALHAASAQIGVASANLLPQFGLTAALGGMSSGLAQMFDAGNIFWALAGSAAQTVFDGGALRARKAGAQAAFEQAGAQYRQTVIGAFQNVADSMRALQFDADALAAQLQAEQAAARGVESTRRAVELGASGYLSLLASQQAYQAAVTGLALARANRLADTVALFQAVGGSGFIAGR